MADPTTVTQYQTGFAPEIAPYAQDLLGQAQALTDTGANPYQVYQGERQAAFTPMQMQSYENAAMMQTAPQLQDATALAGTAGLGALNTGYTYNPLEAKSFNAPGVAQSYMNPYQQGVTDIAQRKAREQAGIADTQRNAQAVQGGAFGGSRQAIGNAAAASGLATQLGDIQAQGLNTAYGQGMQQFNQEQQARQGAAQLNAQQGQFGAGLGLQGLQTAMTGANTLGNLGQTQYGQNMGINQLQNQYGTQQQGQYQNMVNNQYQDFLGAQNYPYKQLGFMSDMLRGLPLSTQGSSVYGGTGNTAAQLLGTGLNIASGAGAFGTPTKAEGGVINGYAEGGMPISRPTEQKLTSMMDGLSDQQLQQILQRPTSLAEFKQAQEEVAFRTSTRGAGIASALPNPESQVSMAGGGIIAFADEGLVPPAEASETAIGKWMRERKENLTAEREKKQQQIKLGEQRVAAIVPPWESVTPSERAAREAKVSAIEAKQNPVSEWDTLEPNSVGLPPVSRPQPKPKAKPAPTAGKGISSALDNLSAQSGESRENLDTAFDRIYGKLRESSKADLDELHNAMKEYAKRPDEIRANSMNAMIGKFGAALAKSGSKPGATFLGSLAEGSAAIPESMAETDKLVREAQDLNIKAKEADARFRISLDRGDKTAAMQELSIKRQLEQGQASIAEQIRSNRAREGLQGQQIAVNSARYKALEGRGQEKIMQTKARLAQAASAQAAKDFSDPMKRMDILKQNPGMTQDAYANGKFKQMWANSMPLEDIGIQEEDGSE